MCTAVRPGSVYGAEGKDRHLRVFSRSDSGAELLVAIVSPEGDIAEIGEAAAPCDDDDDVDLFDEG